MKLEYNSKYISDDKREGLIADGVMMTPTAIGEEDFWVFKAQLTEDQSIIAFPKFGTFGIGFMNEEDWNTNLPYTSDTEKIYNHIKCNKGNNNISSKECQEAIKLVQDACLRLDKGFSIG